MKLLQKYKTTQWKKKIFSNPNNLKLLFLKGLPASSKTTWAKQYCIDNPNFVRISKDDIRSEFFPHYKQKDEKQVCKIESELIVKAFKEGKSVVSDNTNFNPIHSNRLKKIANEFNAEWEEKFFDIPLQECIDRDKNREKSVGEIVIKEMYYKYLQTYNVIPNLEWCVLVDIDGTLAKTGDRNIYDDTKLHLDTVIKPVAEVINKLKGHYKIFIMSGRMDKCKEPTSKWLQDNNIYFDDLFMRKTDDYRGDEIVKWELFCQHINGKYNVLGVFDDRKRVKRMWVSKGLFVFDVNQYDDEY